MPRFRRLSLLAFLALATCSAQAEQLALINARIYPSPTDVPVDRGTVLIKDGRIVDVSSDAAIPSGYVVRDLGGKTVVAGFWNSHVHLLDPPFQNPARATDETLQAALRAKFAAWGFTTIFDLASLPGTATELKRRIADGRIRSPMVLSVDAPFFPEGGTPQYVADLLHRLHAPSFEVVTPKDAAARARTQLERGADGVKLFTGAIVGGDVGVLPMRADIACAVAQEATHRAKPSFAHPTSIEGIEVAVGCGVNVLAHTTPGTGPWPKELTASLVRKRVALVPTLTLFEVEVAKEGAPSEVAQKLLANAQLQTRVYSEAGGTVLFGTDAGYIDLFDTQREIENLSSGGLGWQRILASLTTGPSRYFGYGATKGQVRKGMDADLTVLDGDPAEDVSALARVTLTLKAGDVLYERR
jgi:imidazolonepropionase-like amidohydrolase